MTRALTRKGLETRARIVVGAAEEVRAHGVDDTRLEDVMARVGVSKGQLFHYFPSGKDELLLAVAHHEADQVLSDQPLLGDLTSWDTWHVWRDQLIARYVRQGTNCPLGGLLGQPGRRAPEAQAVIIDLMRRWEAALTDGIRHMQSIGEMSVRVDAAEAGAALLAGIQGGVLLLLATGEVSHLEAAVDVALAGLSSN